MKPEKQPSCSRRKRGRVRYFRISSGSKATSHTLSKKLLEDASLKREQSQEEVKRFPSLGDLAPGKEEVGPRGPDGAGDPSVTLQSESFSQLLRGMGNVYAREAGDTTPKTGTA